MTTHTWYDSGSIDENKERKRIGYTHSRNNIFLDHCGAAVAVIGHEVFRSCDT